MAHDVFISYSTKNKKTADAVCAALEENNIRCWIAPRDITAGKEWGEAIVTAITESKVMVLVFSAAANQSQQVLREVERAVNKNVVIIPFRIEDVVPTKSMEYFLYSTHWLDALTPDMEKHITELAETVAKLVSATKKVKPPKEKVNSQEKANRRQKILMLALAGVTALSLAFGAFGMWTAMSNSRNADDNKALVAVQSTGKSDKGNDKGNDKSGTTEPADTAGMQPDTTQQPGTPADADDTKGQTNRADTGASVKDTGDSSQAAVKQSGGRNTDRTGTTSGAQPAGARKEQGIELKLGDNIRFGVYNGQPVEWKVINLDKNGCPLLFANKIVSVKCFDAGEGAGSADQKRAKYGSNYWINSNIREWLNSAGKTVGYTTAPPAKENVTYDNTYDTEPGFLAGFSAAEMKLVKPCTRSIILPDAEKDLKDRGTEVFSFSGHDIITSTMENYDRAFSKTVQDKVFLLSLKEVKEYVFDRGWNLRTSLTPQAEDRDASAEYKYLKKETENNWSWWLSTPCATSPDCVFYVDYDGRIDNKEAFIACTGIRPALYLSSSKLPLKGTGTDTDPYILSGTAK